MFFFLFQVSKEELAKLVVGFDNKDTLTSSGVTLAGNRYIYLSGTERVIRAKLGKVGVHCMKTAQAVVVSLYEDPIQPQQAASVVEKLGDYLLSCGYQVSTDDERMNTFSLFLFIFFFLDTLLIVLGHRLLYAQGTNNPLTPFFCIKVPYNR